MANCRHLSTNDYVCSNAFRRSGQITEKYNLNISKNCSIVSMKDESPICDFYDNGVILITGGTGFIGKALTEKLLRTCVNLSRIYLLIRPKWGHDIQNRYKQLLESSVFDRIRSEGNSERLLSKITCMLGDITEPNLGLSDEFLKIVTEDVTVVFHSAATVKLNETFETAAKFNTLGAHRVVLLCQKMTKLKSLIYVSTAYSNADKREVDEIVYPVPVNITSEMCDDVLPVELLEKVGKEMVEKHPNTYTVTKAMAEWVVTEFSKNIPTAIVRPSIVTAAWQEPVVGWVENDGGVTGILLGVSSGLIHTILGEPKFIADLIPIDVVVNTLISSAWHVSTCRSDEVKVFNCTSGSVNPLIWKEFGSFSSQHSMKYLQWYPGFKIQTNVFIHWIYEMLFQFLPALVIDVFFRLTGSKPILLKMYNRYKRMAEGGAFVSHNEWHFAIENMQTLQAAIQRSKDREKFNIDIRTLNWDTYMESFVFGIRTYILKDSVQKKLKRLRWAHKFIQVQILFIFIFFVLALFQVI